MGAQDPWGTLPVERTVLAVARTVPCTARLLDVAELFRGDERVAVDFTVNAGSRFGAGIAGMLRDAGVERLVPWEHAAASGSGFDLALVANPKGELHRLGAPMLFMPHGAGHNRLVGTLPGSLSVASGLARSQLEHRGRTLPARLALSHTEQVARLRASYPEAAERAVVVGDPSYDRMLASAERREHYRRALGATQGRRLVVVTSTWHHDSLLGRHGRRLLGALLAQLPHDEYRVALIAHPNVWYRYSPAQLRRWLAPELAAGLRLVPPLEGWRATLVAADVVVGDHGSVSYYAAALGRPVLLATFGDALIAPDSPLAEFGRATPRLDPGGDLRAQLAAAERDGGSLAAADLLIQHPGGSGGRMRRLMYGMLRLSPPRTAAPEPPPLPVPAPHAEEPERFAVEADVTADGVRVRRFATLDPGVGDAERFEVVAAELLHSATAASPDIAVRSHTSETESPAAWIVRTLRRFPGCGLAAASLGGPRALLRLRDGRAVEVELSGTDLFVAAAAVYAWAVDGRPLRALAAGVPVRVGTRETVIRGTPPR
ncbi:UDP-N-acetyl glucosamine 2-epimerase [Marinitenerispora sediminis]|uniref:Translation initiation factor IF-2 n=1 Tax=Marinitenerispora sediminis TaxID=1931232 RepID=A0A368T8G9_9ACTN|nr:translation initiation factor IF-2 [Marinitenerispora sediminis]RCV53599.1 translation initiation factor IF-2 [Marinitenerispora sediminis]RCV55960.1 translation initiation factor IF-2 [Marinitenerispora sediminis]RCV60672.1 translation initiation factor IF-2 [Marinitenerispora sediminis]